MPKPPEGNRKNEESALSPRRMAAERAQDIQRLAGGSLTREQIRRAMPEGMLDDLEPNDDSDNDDNRNSQADWYRGREEPII